MRQGFLFLRMGTPQAERSEIPWGKIVRGLDTPG